ncbi:MAG: hypothetical protein WC819_03615 [Parcubacteria group bacterium]|jgi:hypothetical protein
MALTIEGQVKVAKNLVQLVGIANSIPSSDVQAMRADERKIHEQNLNHLRAGIDRLTTDDLDDVSKFVRACRHHDLRHLAIRQHIRASWVPSLFEMEQLILLVLSRIHKDAVAGLVREILAKGNDLFIVPESPDAEILNELMQVAERIHILLDSAMFASIDHIPAVDIFASEIVDAMVGKIMNGQTYASYFLHERNSALHCCDLIMAISLEEAVTADILLDAMHAPIFYSDECRGSINEAPYIGVTYDVFLRKLIDLVEYENVELSLDQLKIIARNITAPRGGEAEMQKKEEFVIQRALPFLIVDGGDPSGFAQSFMTRTGKHRFIVAYLQTCDTLTKKQLKGLAECVTTRKFFGDAAADALFTAKKKFGLKIDVAKALKKAEEDAKEKRIAGIAIMIGGPSAGMTGAMSTEEEIAEMMRQMQAQSGGFGTVH